MECSLCTSDTLNPHCPMCCEPVDPDLIAVLEVYLDFKDPDQCNIRLARHLAKIVQAALDDILCDF